MGQEIVYCFKCSTRILGTDFDKGTAFQVGNHTACKACAQELLATLPPAEREALRARMTKAVPEKGGSSPRLPAQKGGPRAGDTPRSTPRVSFPAVPDPPAAKSPKGMLLAIAGIGGLVLVLLGVMMSGGKEEPPPRRDTEKEDRAERESARREQERADAKKREAASREFAALEEQLKDLQFREEFRKGLDALADARKRRGEADWQVLIDKKTKDLREVPRGLYPGLKEKAIAARKRQAPAEVKVVEDRVAKWGLDEFSAELRDSLAAVVIEPGPFQESPEGVTVMEAENYHAKIDMPGVAWTPVTAPADFQGKGALQALPNVNGSIEVEKSPRVDYKVSFVKTGVHYVWIRCAANDGTDDSLYFGLNGVKADPAAYLTIDAKKKWLWSNKLKNGKEAKLDIPSPGVHTFSVWPREDGAMIDRIVLTTQPKYPVSGGGPAESPR